MNLFCLLILSLLGCGDKTVEDSVVMTLDDTGSSNVVVPVADCSVELTGVSWGEPAVSDHNPSFEATLDAIDFEALPEQFDFFGQGVIFLFQELELFCQLGEFFLPAPALPDKVYQKENQSQG